jgi:hypothetical protein
MLMRQTNVQTGGLPEQVECPEEGYEVRCRLNGRILDLEQGVERNIPRAANCPDTDQRQING